MKHSVFAKIATLALALVLVLSLAACGKKSDSGVKILVPNDTTNEARALLLLQENGIITLKDGVLGLVGKGVGTKGSLAGMLKQVGDDIHPDPRLPIYYGYSGDDTLCRQFVPLMEEKFGPHGQEIRSIGCVIGTHLGPNAAVVAYLEQDK